MLSDVTGETCREYAALRGGSGGARRDLEDLRAAINHHAKEGFHRGIVRVALPLKGQPRDRWLTRDEVAKLLWVCWRTREVQTQHRGKLKGQKIQTDKHPLRHLARFILLAVYTGTRAASVAAASPVRAEGRSFVDLANGIFYRLAHGQRETNKRQPPVPIPPRLLAHLRRWHATGLARGHVVEFNGQPVRSVKTAFKHAVRLARLSGRITPHTLRHTAATWLMQAGVDRWEAAGFLGMSVEMLDRVYGHHHPDHLREAARAIGYRPRQSLAQSLARVRAPSASSPQAFEKAGGGSSRRRTRLRLKFPANREKNREICNFGGASADQKAHEPNVFWAFEVNSLLERTGNFFVGTGNFGAGTGNFTSKSEINAGCGFRYTQVRTVVTPQQSGLRRRTAPRIANGLHISRCVADGADTPLAAGSRCTSCQ